MHEFYGRKGKTNNPMSPSYIPTTELVIKRDKDYIIAEGQWVSTYDFILKSGALILGKDNAQGDGINKIKRQLKEEKLFEDDSESDYTLLANIHLYSPSAAGRLVQGQQSNGHSNWVRKSDGKSLKDLNN